MSVGELIESLEEEIAQLKAELELSEASNKEHEAKYDEHLAEIVRLKEELGNERARGIHSCSEYCTRPMCVLRRERDKLKADKVELVGKIEFVKAIANNAIYFADNSDYWGSLWTVCNYLGMGIDDIGTVYMEDKALAKHKEG